MKSDVLYPLRCIHGKIHDTWYEYHEAKSIASRIKSYDKNIVLYVFTPTHENLGDHAIAIAGQKCLRQVNLCFVEITLKELSLLRKHYLLSVINGHPIIVNGGGNIGTLWPKVEDLFREIIRKSPDSSIVCLPNTAFFEDSEKGRADINKSKKIYNAHPALHICAREKQSYDILKKIFENTVLVPDLVLSLDESYGDSARKGCVLCLRRDIERTRSVSEDEEIRHQAEILFGANIQDKDTCIDHKISVDSRESEFEKLLDSFRAARLVITDRLHGMIFAAITGTPCIVLNSKSHKVKGCYEWISHLEYIKFADSVEEINAKYAEIPHRKYRYDNACLQPYFEELKHLLVKEMGRHKPEN